MYQRHPQAAADSLPTMYDLPSEDPEDMGLPDEFHDFQPKLLRETCQPTTYTAADIFIGADLNLYYDGRHPQWYKRPDWFLVLGTTVADRVEDLRWSYVTWQESVNPFVVVELLSPGTEDEDLGQKVRSLGKPPLKWEVYEQILRIPFYVVFDRYVQHLRVFALSAGRYSEVKLIDGRFWFEAIGLGLAVWSGRYQGIEGQWLRWYDAAGTWVPTAAERANAEAERANAETERADAAAERANAEIERANAETERANTETERANAEAERANAETERANAEAQARRQAIPKLMGLGLSVTQVAETLGLSVAEVEDFQGD
jgi:Uma2 family endonuclease